MNDSGDTGWANGERMVAQEKVFSVQESLDRTMAARTKSGVPDGDCINCKNPIGEEILKINQIALYCQACNLAKRKKGYL